MAHTVIPPIVTQDRASGAQVIGGSLRFNKSKNQFLSKTFTKQGNRKTFTYSVWCKRASFGDWQRLFTCEPDSSNIAGLAFRGSSNVDGIRVQTQNSGANNDHWSSNAIYRDNEWYHIVMRVDNTLATADDRIRIYVNGVLQSGSYDTGSAPDPSETWYYNSTSVTHCIGKSHAHNAWFGGNMSQNYWLDGQSVGPEAFGFTDPLTNVWRPKRFIPTKVNNGTTWSDGWGTPGGGWHGSGGAVNALDGNLATYTSANSTGTEFTWTNPGTLSGKLRVYCDATNSGIGAAVKVNGSQVLNAQATQWYDLGTYDSITSISFVPAGGNRCWVYAIEVDGVILLDGDTSNYGLNGFYLPFDGKTPIGEDQSGRGNDWDPSPTFEGGSTNFKDATGALPILDVINGDIGSASVRKESSNLEMLKDQKSGCVFFDGDNDYLQIPHSSNYNLGNSNFTLEFWLHPTNTFSHNDNGFISIGENSGTKRILQISGHIATTNGINLAASSNGSAWDMFNMANIGTATMYKWQHLAVVRNGTALTTYKDGVQIHTTNIGTTSFFSNGDYTIQIGNYLNSGSAFAHGYEGFISNVRLVVGTAVYTGAFTPSTGPLTSTGGDYPSSTNINAIPAGHTKLLCCQHSNEAAAATVSSRISGVNNGTQWSKYLQISRTASTMQDAYKAFDGNTGTRAQTASNGTYRQLRFAPPAIKFSSKLEVYCDQGDSTPTASWYGNTVNPGMNSWVTLYSGSGTISSEYPIVIDTQGAGQYATLKGVRVDDVILLDPITPIGATSSTSGPAASYSEFDGSCVFAAPLVGNCFDYSNRANNRSFYKDFSRAGAESDTNKGICYGSSWWFDGSNDEIEYDHGSDFNLHEAAYTIEGWFYLYGSPTTNHRILTARNRNEYQIRITSNMALQMLDDGAGQSVITANNVIQQDRWHHFAMVCHGTGSNDMKIYVDGVLRKTGLLSGDKAEGTGITVGRESTQGHWWKGRMQDLRFYKGIAKYTKNFSVGSNDPDVVADTPSANPYRLKPKEPVCGSVAFSERGSDNLSVQGGSDFRFGTGDFTIEGWFYISKKTYSNNCMWDLRDNGSGTSVAGYFMKCHTDNSTIELRNGSGTMGSTFAKQDTWCHIAVTRNGTDVRVYVDGQPRIQSTDSTNAVGERLIVGSFYDTIGSGSNSGFNGFVSNFRLCKGEAVYSGNVAFKPPREPLKVTSCTKLLFCKSTTNELAFDASPTTPVNGSPTDVVASKLNPFSDSTEVVPGSMTAFNPLFSATNQAGSISDQNLYVHHTDYLLHKTKIQFGKDGITTGKYYWEVRWDDNHGSQYAGITGNLSEDGGEIASGTNKSWFGSTSKKNYTASSSSNHGGEWIQGKTYGYALDLDNRVFKMYQDGILRNNDTTIPDPKTTVLVPFTCTTNSGGSADWANGIFNFGQRPFRHTPPEGFVAPNYQNVELSTVIMRPEKYHDTVLYNGDETGQSITLGFKPDLVWIKKRNASASSCMFDTLRGATKRIKSDSENAELTQADSLTSFDDHGFTLGSNGHTSENSHTFVAWCWKAGGNSGNFNYNDVGYATAAAMNTATGVNMDAGNINPAKCTVGSKQKFSIVKYVGNGSNNQTLAHGLGVVPELVMVKNLTDNVWWNVKFKDLSSNRILYLNDNDDEDTASGSQHGHIGDLNNATTVNFTTNGSNYQNTNDNGKNYIMYSWATVPGYSKVGVWYGTNNNDGRYVDCGFRPKMLWFKNSDNVEDWYIIDTPRWGYNKRASSTASAAVRTLNPNQPDDETGSMGGHHTATVDLLATGFKIKTTNKDSGEISFQSRKYVYIAFAEQPAVNMYGAQPLSR